MRTSENSSDLERGPGPRSIAVEFSEVRMTVQKLHRGVKIQLFTFTLQHLGPGVSYNLSLQNIDVIESVHRKTQRIWTGGAAPSSNPLSFPMYGLYNSNKSRFWSRSHGDKGYTYWDFESHSPLCYRNVANGQVILKKASFHNLEVAHQSWEGSWGLWYHSLSKEMRCAHTLHTT